MSQSVTGLFKDKASATVVIDMLLSQGLTKRDLSLLMSDSNAAKEFAANRASKAPEGTAIGAATGGVIGAVAAGVAAVAAIATTGGTGIVAAGPILTILAAGGVGATAGGIFGGLLGLGFDETEAKVVSDEIENGAVLLIAEVPEARQKEVENIYHHYGSTKTTVH